MRYGNIGDLSNLKFKRNVGIKEDKINNHKISKQHIFIENVIENVKKFGIFSLKYRNRKKCFGFNLLSVIYNFAIDLLYNLNILTVRW